MKTLFLIRHAKSDWNDTALNDFDRPLNDRGKRDAPVMAHRLLDKDIDIDAFVTSPAKRARKTASIFAKELKKDKSQIIFKDELYLAPAEVFYKVIDSMDDKFDSIAIFSHNPGITEFANSLTDTHIDNIPTAGVFAVRIKTGQWSHFKNAKKEFWFADYPKAAAE